MDPKKTDLVIKYNLHWKNAPTSSAKNRVNIVGMCDLPASTRNLEKFKSYLLKNSGATADDVKVSYIGDDDKEFPIETQDDFQTALNYFREVARSGNTITLKLDRVFYKNKSEQLKRTSSGDSSPMDKVEEVFEAEEDHQLNVDEAPQWFTKYMQEFKKEMAKEVIAAVVKCISTANAEASTSEAALPATGHQMQLKKKCKEKGNVSQNMIPEMGTLPKKKLKTSKNIIKATGDNIAVEKDALKERKLDLKLAKLENRTMKIKEKKAALQMKHNTESSFTSSPRLMDLAANEIENLMGAIPVGQHEATIPHMMGGEIFQQEWTVVNTGQLPWTSETELHYAWGSEALKPVKKIYPCPNLKPREEGIVKVQLEVPKKAGSYESYWYFHHIGRRFGHWLGCQVIVDRSPVKSFFERNSTAAAVSPASPPTNLALQARKLLETIVQERNAQSSVTTGANNEKEQLSNSVKEMEVNLDKQEKENLQKDIQELSNNLKNLKIPGDEYADGSNSSDTDNQSIVSITDSNTSSSLEEFVVVAMPKEQKNDGNLETNENNNSREEMNKLQELKLEDVVTCSDHESDTEDYIKINDKKIPIPRVDFPSKNDELKEENKPEAQSVKEEAAGPSQETEKPSNELIEVKTEKVNADPPKQEDVKPENLPEPVDVEYAYVTVAGEKVAVPKQFLRADFLARAEPAEPPAPAAKTENVEQALPLTAKTEENKQEEVKTQLSPAQKIETITTSRPDTAVSTSMYEFVQEPTPLSGHDLDNVRNTQSVYISAATTPDASLCSLHDNASAEEVKSFASEDFRTNYPNNTRLFVFPQNCPGFEVFCTPYNNNESFTNYSSSQTNGAQPEPNSYTNPLFSHCSNTSNASGSFYATDGTNRFSYQQSYSNPPPGPFNTYANYGYQHCAYSTPNQQQQQQQQQISYPNIYYYPNGVYGGQCYASADVCHQATEHARQAAMQAGTQARQAGEQARQAAMQAGAQARQAGEQARQAAMQAGEQARQAAMQAAEKARQAAMQAGDQARQATLERARTLAAETTKFFAYTNGAAQGVQREESPRSASYFSPSSTSSPPNTPCSDATQKGSQPQPNFVFPTLNADAAPNGLHSEGNRQPEISNSGGNSRNSSFKGILPVSMATVPENIVSGAVNAASSAINTARSVLSMLNPEPGSWVNGHWVTSNTESKRERSLRILEEMGFLDRDLNATLLARYNDDVTQVISELVQ